MNKIEFREGKLLNYLIKFNNSF